jgi:hypothetical protein
MAGPSQDGRLAARGQNSNIFRIFQDGITLPAEPKCRDLPEVAH